MERLRTIGLMMHELIMNALKHAHPAKAAGVVEVSCVTEPDGTVSLIVADDGVGFPEAFDHKAANSFGMRLTRKLAAQLGGELSFESTDLGLTCRFRAAPQPV
jgi:two-component sensor histidine kinase